MGSPSPKTLPKRTPDPAHTLAGAFQHLLSEYITSMVGAVAHIPDVKVQQEIIDHTRVVHTEALKVLMEVGERVEESSKQGQ